MQFNQGGNMSTGDGILTAMMMYLVWQGFLVWLSFDKAVRRPAATEARLERLERALKYLEIDL